MEFFSFRYRERDEDYEDPRRDFLVKALSLGLFAAGASTLPACGLLPPPGRRPLPPGRSIHRMRGDVRVNGVQPSEDTLIRPDATIETGSNSELVFAVGTDAFIVRENSWIELHPLAAAGGGGGAGDAGLRDTLIGTLRAVSGRILSVFGERSPEQSLSLRTSTATIGIRGTGLYLEAGDDRSYVCTCYGSTLLGARGVPDATEAITASHHDAPRYILRDAENGRRIVPAPVINHTDMELVLIESLVGRRPPFGTAGGTDY